MSKADENTDLNEKINNFVRKNRTPILVSIGIIVLVLAGFIITVSVIGASRNRAISAVEDLFSRYETLRPSISADPLPNGDSSGSELETLLTDLETFAKKTGGYAGGRAWAIIAAIHGGKKDWAQAENAWTSAANTAKKTYLEPIAWFNAAACAEEQGKNEQALEYYANSLEVKAAFPAAVQAQFSIGRLKETGGDREGAIEAYRTLISRWSYDTTWANLAHSRIAALEAQAQ